MELHAYRIDDYLFVVETSAVWTGDRRAFRSQAYVLVEGDRLRLVQQGDSGDFTCVGVAASRARNDLVQRLAARLRAVAMHQGGIDAAACERRGTWALPG